MTATEEHHTIRTFKPRRRQLSPARAALYERLAPTLCLSTDGPPFDPELTFGRRAPLVLDIGIGAGDALSEQAAADPGVDVIGADVHTPGIAATMARIESTQLSNVRLVHGDAVRFAGRLAPSSLSGIRIYFPDPWPKARHRNRRLISPHHLDLFCRLLSGGGTLHVATDMVDYADHVVALCHDRADLDGGVVARPPWRPTTRYERKGLDAGRTVTDLIYRVRKP